MIDDFEIGRAVFTLRRRRDFATQRLRQEMLPVADAEDGHVCIEDI